MDVDYKCRRNDGIWVSIGVVTPKPTEEQVKRAREIVTLRAEAARLREALEVSESAFEQLHDLVDQEFVTTETDDGEKEQWVNSFQVQSICDEVLTKISREALGIGGGDAG